MISASKYNHQVYLKDGVLKEGQQCVKLKSLRFDNNAEKGL